MATAFKVKIEDDRIEDIIELHLDKALRYNCGFYMLHNGVPVLIDPPPLEDENESG